MDELTKQVSEMYAKFTYPSPQAHGHKLKELRNLLTIFSMENRYDLKGKSVLDAGTGPALGWSRPQPPSDRRAFWQLISVKHRSACPRGGCP